MEYTLARKEDKATSAEVRNTEKTVVNEDGLEAVQTGIPLYLQVQRFPGVSKMQL